MKTWLLVAIYLHVVFAGAAFRGWSVLTVLVLHWLCLLLVALDELFRRHVERPRWITRIVRRMK